MASRPRGRPSKLDGETRDNFLRSLRAGNYLETAASFAGLSKVTIYDWLKRGRRARAGEFRDFLNAVEKAQADSETLAVSQVTAAAKNHWQAAAWRLERMFPSRWGHRVKVTIEKEQEAFLDRLERKLPPAVYEMVLAAGLPDESDGEEASEAAGEAPAGGEEEEGDAEEPAGVHSEDQPGAGGAYAPEGGR